VRKLVAAIFLALCGCAPGSGIIPLPLPLPLPIPIPIPTSLTAGLDGQWELADAFGGKSCLVIQEARVSILDLTCSSDGLGLAARINDSPTITGGGSTIILTVVYNRKTFETVQFRLVFAGQRQPDGTFIGTRRDEVLDEDGEFSEVIAILARP